MLMDARFIWEVIFASALLIGFLSYYLGRSKTKTPLLAGLLGTVISIIPLFGIAYLVILLLRHDIETTAAIP